MIQISLKSKYFKNKHKFIITLEIKNITYYVAERKKLGLSTIIILLLFMKQESHNMTYYVNELLDCDESTTLVDKFMINDTEVALKAVKNGKATGADGIHKKHRP